MFSCSPPGCPATNPYVRVLIFYVSTLCLVQAQLVHYRQTPSPFQVPFSSPKSQTPDPDPSAMPADPRCSQIPDWFKTPAAMRDQLFQMLSMRWLRILQCIDWEYIGDVIECLPALHHCNNQRTFLSFALDLILFICVSLCLFLFSAAWRPDIQKLLLHFDSEQAILFRDHF